MDPPVLPWGPPPAERADAARNRRHLLATARTMLAEHGADKLTMDGLADRAGLGKGTVFRRFGTRAGIFAALLDDDERAFQQEVLAGPPPLGPGATPLDRLIAYGRARTRFLIAHCHIARAALDGHQPIPAGSQSPMSQVHIRMLLGQIGLSGADLDTLAIQLTAALDGPPLLYLSASDLAATPLAADRIAQSWQDLVQRACRPLSQRSDGVSGRGPDGGVDRRVVRSRQGSGEDGGGILTAIWIGDDADLIAHNAEEATALGRDANG